MPPFYPYLIEVWPPRVDGEARLRDGATADAVGVRRLPSVIFKGVDSKYEKPFVRWRSLGLFISSPLSSEALERLRNKKAPSGQGRKRLFILGRGEKTITTSRKRFCINNLKEQSQTRFTVQFSFFLRPGLNAFDDEPQTIIKIRRFILILIHIATFYFISIQILFENMREVLTDMKSNC